METVIDLEKKLDEWKTNNLQLMALAHIGTYCNHINGKLTNIGEDFEMHVQEVCAIKDIIAQDLNAAIVSPNLYIREWGRFVQNKEVYDERSETD